MVAEQVVEGGKPTGASWQKANGWEKLPQGENKVAPWSLNRKQQLSPPPGPRAGTIAGGKRRGRWELAAVWEARAQRQERGGPLLTERSCPLPFLLQVIAPPTPTGKGERILPPLTLEGSEAWG